MRRERVASDSRRLLVAVRPHGGRWQLPAVSGRRFGIALALALFLAAPAASATVEAGPVMLVSLDESGGQFEGASGFRVLDDSSIVFAAQGGFYRRELVTGTTELLFETRIEGDPVSVLGLDSTGSTALAIRIVRCCETSSGDREQWIYKLDISSGEWERLLVFEDPAVALPGSIRPGLGVWASRDLSVVFTSYGSPVTPATYTRFDLDTGGVTTETLEFVLSRHPYSRILSDDGSRSVWTSDDDGNLIDEVRGQVYVHDFDADTDTLASVGIDGTPSNGINWEMQISGDGSRVFFSSDATNLVDHAVPQGFNTYMADWATGEVWHIAAVGGVTPNVDGSVLMISQSRVLDNGLSVNAIYSYELASEELTVVSRGPDGELPNLSVEVDDLSADGSLVLMTSEATNLVIGDENRADEYSGFDAFVAQLTVLPFDDVAGSKFRDDILWLLDEGITRGCSSDGRLFCPDDPVTRGQMAAFLNRALVLDPGEGDTFVDDEGSIFETDTEALVAAGITRGCNDEGDRFCPDDLVTRGQMAAFLARGFGLEPPVGVDTFVDDEGSIFESDIEALVAAGITLGCNEGGDAFCPDDHLTRGQMAAFLHSALSSPA